MGFWFGGQFGVLSRLWDGVRLLFFMGRDEVKFGVGVGIEIEG